MRDLLRTIGGSGDLIQGWEVTRQPGGVLLRARSRRTFTTSDGATEAGSAILARITRSGFEPVSEPVVRARSDGTSRGEGWQAWVEVVLRPVPRRTDRPATPFL